MSESMTPAERLLHAIFGDRANQELAVAIFEMTMKREWTEDYEGSREWDAAQDAATAFLSSTPDNPIVLTHPGGNTHIGWYGPDAFSDPVKWIAAGWQVSALTPDEARARHDSSRSTADATSDIRQDSALQGEPGAAWDSLSPASTTGSEQ